MTLTRIASNAVLVSHCDRQCTFVNGNFVEMCEWAKEVQEEYTDDET